MTKARRFTLTLTDDTAVVLGTWTLAYPWRDNVRDGDDFGLPLTLLGRAMLADELARAAGVPLHPTGPHDPVAP